MHKCNQFVARRNDIAHGKREWVGGRGHYLLPAFYNRKKHRPGQAMAFCYSSKEIRTYANHFIDLQSLADRMNSAASAMLINTPMSKRQKAIIPLLHEWDDDE